MRAALVPPPTFLPFDELVIARFYRDIVIDGAWFNLQKSLLVVNISILVLRLDRSLWIAQCSTSSYERKPLSCLRGPCGWSKICADQAIDA
jgi:hypothetical protein